MDNKRINLDYFVKCPRCKVDVKKKNLKKHEKHHKKKDEKKLNSRPRLCDMPQEKRRKWLDSLDKPDREFSQDVYSRGKVVRGGAYGLGRNRRN